MYVFVAAMIIIIVYANSFKDSINAEKVDKTVPKLIVIAIVFFLLSLLLGC